MTTPLSAAHPHPTPIAALPAQDSVLVQDLMRRFSRRLHVGGVRVCGVTLTRDDRPDDALVLIMERRTPFTWKLAGVDLTPDPMG